MRDGEATERGATAFMQVNFAASPWKAGFLLELVKKVWIKGFSEGCGLIKRGKISEPGQNCFRNG